MYYILENDKIVLFDEDKAKLQQTILFMPHYQGLPIKETDKNIVQFEGQFYFEDDEEYVEKKSVYDKQTYIETIKKELYDLDIKRIRAICEGGENPDTKESWLEYYNNKVKDLRSELSKYSIT